MWGMLGINVQGMLEINVRKMFGMLGSLDRCNYMNVCISKFMYVCICNIFLILKS